jgi:hypothetical protein
MLVKEYLDVMLPKYKLAFRSMDIKGVAQLIFGVIRTVLYD